MVWITQYANWQLHLLHTLAMLQSLGYAPLHDGQFPAKKSMATFLPLELLSAAVKSVCACMANLHIGKGLGLSQLPIQHTHYGFVGLKQGEQGAH